MRKIQDFKQENIPIDLIQVGTNGEMVKVRKMVKW